MIGARQWRAAGRGGAVAAWLGCVVVLFAPAPASAAERVVFCEAQVQACAGATRLGDAPPRGWWAAMDDRVLIEAARAGKPLPTLLYPSQAAYQEATAGLRGQEVAAAVLRRLPNVRAGATAAAPPFLFGVVRDDMQEVIRAAGPAGGVTVEGTLAAAVALAGGRDRFKDLSPGECVTRARESVARLRAELKGGPPAAGYAREAERLAALLAVLRPHNAERASLPDVERAYFIPDQRPPAIRDEMFADDPWYAWRGGTVRLLRGSEVAKPAWRGRKLRLMYVDRASFLADLTSLTDAQMNRRLSAWLSGPPPEAVAALVSRLAFDHAVEMRQCTAARAAPPPAPADWDGLTKLALDNLHLVLQRAGRTPAAGLRAAVGRLRADATLLDVLVHAGPTTSLIVPAVDRFQAAVQRLAN